MLDSELDDTAREFAGGSTNWIKLYSPMNWWRSTLTSVPLQEG